MHSQEQWAQVYGVNPATISRWEKGLFGTNYDALVSISLATKVGMNYFFLGVVPEWPPKPLRDLLHEKDPTLTTSAQFGAAIVTQRKAGALHAPRPPRQSPRRRRGSVQ